MTLDHFWELIDKSRANLSDKDQDQQVANLKELLSPLSPEEILSFDHHFRAMTQAANHYDLWGVAYLINCGCSDDGFLYFRWALIAEGRERFEKAVKDPESLADWCWEEFEFEEIAYLVTDVFEEKTGQSFYDEYDRAYPDEGWPEPTGKSWTEEDLPARFPKAAAKFDHLDSDEFLDD